MRGCDEGGNWQKEGGEGAATTPNPNPNSNRGRGVSLARLECGQRQSRCSGALPLAAPAPLRIELRLLEFQNHRGELRVYVLFVLTCRLFRRASPMKDIVRRKALQSAPRIGRIFASEGALGDLWAVCRVVKSTARACPYGRLGQTTKPARGRTRHACQSAKQSPGYATQE